MNMVLMDMVVLVVVLMDLVLSLVLQLEMMQPPLEGLPLLSCTGSGYNELLYAHLLDGEVRLVQEGGVTTIAFQGQRLTYTHFTAKVNWNSMIEITFNRSVRLNKNKVYRIGMVLNKVRTRSVLFSASGGLVPYGYLHQKGQL